MVLWSCVKKVRLECWVPSRERVHIPPFTGPSRKIINSKSAGECRGYVFSFPGGYIQKMILKDSPSKASDVSDWTQESRLSRPLLSLCWPTHRIRITSSGVFTPLVKVSFFMRNSVVTKVSLKFFSFNGILESPRFPVTYLSFKEMCQMKDSPKIGTPCSCLVFF